MNEIIFEVLLVAVMLISVLIAKHLIPYLIMMVETSKQSWILNFVKAAVRAAEQTVFGEKTGPEKKAIVTKKMKQLLINKNIDMTDEQLDMLIEAAVYNMNYESE